MFDCLCPKAERIFFNIKEKFASIYINNTWAMENKDIYVLINYLTYICSK